MINKAAAVVVPRCGDRRCRGVLDVLVDAVAGIVEGRHRVGVIVSVPAAVQNPLEHGLERLGTGGTSPEIEQFRPSVRRGVKRVEKRSEGDRLLAQEALQEHRVRLVVFASPDANGELLN